MKGQIKIRKGYKGQVPTIVYVEGFNPNFDLWVTPILNKDTFLLSREEDLIDFDFELFQNMYYKWKLKRLPKLKKIYEKELNKLNQTEKENN